jgi:hypothetical protein
MLRMIGILLAAMYLVGVNNAFAQASGYTKINVKNQVQLEIPDEWTINDAEHRKRIRDFSKKLSEQANDEIAALSVHSFPSPSRMWIRVSFIPMDPPLSQADLTKELRTGEKEFLKGLRDGWQEEAPSMWATLGKQGIREVGRPSFAIEQLGGKTAFVIRYGRTSANDSTQTVKVAQYHVLLGKEKALITLSYFDGDPQVLAAHNRIKNSIAIR